MKKYLIRFFVPVLILFTFHYSVHAQYDPSHVNKKAQALYDQAVQDAGSDDLIGAAGFLIKAVQLDSNYVDALLALGDVYGKLKNYKKSIQSFERAISIDTVYTLDAKYNYSIQLAGDGEFEKALDAINDLLTKKPPKSPASLAKMNRWKQTFQFAVDYARNNPDKNYVFAPHNLGDSINSRESEYFPTLSIDGSKLVFTRRVRNTDEDFYYSNSVAGGWSPAQPLPGEINTEQNEAAQTVSADGKYMVFTASGRAEGYGNYDLYSAEQTETGWGHIQNLGGRINSDQWDAQPCLSPDGRDLYFASKRPGGFGGSDIYVCHVQRNGKWGEPENLGPQINTAGDDQCPFIHADNQTLYFTSNGWPGYGNNDLFMSRKNADGSWTKPFNLGYPINTIDDEGTLFIAADGKTAFFASDRNDSRGGLDIYTFTLRENIRPFKTLLVKGKVTDKKTQQPVEATVELIDLVTRETLSKVQTDPAGNYLITLPVGRDYDFTVNKKGYLFYSDNFFMAGRSPDSAYQKNILLQPIELNATVILKNIYFDVNKFGLKPESQAELDKLVQLLNENPALKIEISGHTDNVGKATDNLTLSNNRAAAVVNYLTGKNIAPQRLVAKGYGETKPVADNKTEEGRALNRRTEMKVIAN